METIRKKAIWVPIVAVAMGYFVDLYDLLVFSSVRVESLKELKIEGSDAVDQATNLLNLTVIGMVLGGFFWGILADKKGRISVLFASIATYTLFNFLNAFVNSIFTYQVCRFMAGFGLAGELGVGVTLISEGLHKRFRTWATAIITACGMLGAATSGILANTLKGHIILGLSSWRFLFMAGGLMGAVLLVLRIRLMESPLFNHSVENNNRGDLWYLLSERRRSAKYLFCILSGLPVFFIIGNFISLAPEYGKHEGIDGVQASTAVLSCYLSIALFDFLGTLLSKKLKSRKKVLVIFLSIQAVSILTFLYVPCHSLWQFYLKCAFLGMGIGYWGVMVINSAEQFGTNLRATVATSVPNLVRGALFPLSVFIFTPLKGQIGLVPSGAMTAFLTLILAIISVAALQDRFENDVDFQEN